MSKKFRRQEWYRYKRLGEKWRKPRGRDSRMRRRLSGRPPLVEVGFRSPRGARGLHPTGLREILIHNLKELEAVDPKKEAVRVAAGVGGRLRKRILERARSLGVRVLNAGERK